MINLPALAKELLASVWLGVYFELVTVVLPEDLFLGELVSDGTGSSNPDPFLLWILLEMDSEWLNLFDECMLA